MCVKVGEAILIVLLYEKEFFYFMSDLLMSYLSNLIWVIFFDITANLFRAHVFKLFTTDNKDFVEIFVSIIRKTCDQK